MSEVMVTAHGYEFVRSGHCRQCGACGCGKRPCPHHYTKEGKHCCDVYPVRFLVCASCSEAAGEEVTHAGCVGFPDNPWIGVVRDGTCGYSFRRADGGSMDDLPFLGGEPYLR
jgi:hypothetical protein